MTGNVIANRYAKALFHIGKEKSAEELESYSASLVAVDQALKSSAQLMTVLTSPMFTQEEKKKVMLKMGDSLSLNPTILNFCLLLTEKKRMAVFSYISGAFERLLDEEKGILRGTILTAVALPKKRQEAVLEDLGKKTKNELALEFEVDPDILGGLILQVGDKVMDASLRAQLSILKESIKRGE